MTSATDRLRALLDERGVEWTGSDTRMGFIVDGIDWEAYEHVVFGEPSGLLSVMTTLTPEQAIDATLGRGTCRDVGRYAFVCSECGWASDEPHHVLGGFWPKYCPECGRVVVND